MTVTYRFFENGDYYTQENFADFLRALLTDGYIPGIGAGLNVTATSPASMMVTVGTGMGVVNGYIVENEGTPVSLTISAPSSQPRIDRVIVRLSAITGRSIEFAVLKGTPAASPSAPALTHTDDVYEMSLAQIRVNSGTTTITSSNITDERATVRNDPCGLKHASTTEYGAIKVGANLQAVDGVLSVVSAPYPLAARLYPTNQNVDTFIQANRYDGLVGQKLMCNLQNTEATHTVNFTVGMDIWDPSTLNAARARAVIQAQNVMTGVCRDLYECPIHDTWSHDKVSFSDSGTVTVKLCEVVTARAEVVSTEGGAEITQVTSNNNNVWLGKAT